MSKNENKHVLNRYIPVDVKRDVRKKSKFGCVVCRGAVAHYEHIDPPFKDAEEHNPDNICCLCGSCHDKVNRGFFSKDLIQKKYEEVQSSSDTPAPRDVFDLHTNQAKLLVAGNKGTFAPGITFSVYGHPVLQANPGESGSGEIYADFSDEKGRPLLRIIGNQWVAFDKAWDVKVEGTTISVNSSEKLEVLQLDADPPDTVIVQRVDMRVGPFHLMATKDDFMMGRYLEPGRCFWITTSLSVKAHATSSALIEATPPQGENFRISPETGVRFEPVGISIAPCYSSLGIKKIDAGTDSVESVRDYFF